MSQKREVRSGMWVPKSEISVYSHSYSVHLTVYWECAINSIFVDQLHKMIPNFAIMSDRSPKDKNCSTNKNKRNMFSLSILKTTDKQCIIAYTPSRHGGMNAFVEI